MVSRPVSDETLIRRMLPEINPDRQDRARAWAEWQAEIGEAVLTRFIRAHNSTRETDEDILQDALLTAYLGMEGGRYRPQAGVPFAAYVIGIARNKIREAQRRHRRQTDLAEDAEIAPPVEGEMPRQPERSLERREERAMLRRGLDGLPETRRKVIEHYLGGESTGEIAQRLKISEDLVRQHKCRGLRMLKMAVQTGALVQAV